MRIIDIVGIDSFFKGRNYNTRYLHPISVTYDEENNCFINKFFINSETFRNKGYDVEIINNGDDIKSFSCTCPQFINKSTCKHVAAVLYNYAFDITSHIKIDEFSISNEIMDILNRNKNISSRQVLRKKINYHITLNPEHPITIKLQLGDTRLYMLTASKVSGFLDAINYNETYTFGKSFTYDPNKYYLDETLTKLIDFINLKEEENNNNIYFHNYYENQNPLEVTSRELPTLLNIIKDNFYVENTKINNIIYDLPTEFHLSKKDDIFELKIDDIENYKIYDDCIIYKDVFSLPPEKYKKLLFKFLEYGISSLKIKKSNLDKFKNNVFGSIKDKLLIDDNISEITLPSKPLVNLYFNINKVFSCKIEFNYNGKKVNYFDKYDIYRDNEFEQGIFNELLNDNFKELDSELIIDDQDGYYDFINNRLDYYVKNYNTFIDKNIKNTSFKSNISVSNNFSLGKDNILSYSFNIDGISNDEIDGLFKALKAKKKYYKLKDSSVLKLDENEELEDLNDIIDDLNIDKNELLNDKIIVPKYRALYIDSLKSKKNIHTNNLFNSFIDNFEKYKNVELNLDKKDYNILRDYQLDGIKWLKSIYKCGFGGILADEMGLGKSLQTIMLIKEILKEKKDSKILIVSPTSLVYNWELEFRKFAPKLKFVSVQDNKTKRLEIFNKKDEYNIFITSYGLIRNDNDEYEKMNFELCVIDEAQTIKNYKAQMSREVKKIKANTKIALTGTPIENNLTELWSIFDFIMPGYLNNILVFQDKFKIKEIDKDTKKVLESLQKLIKPFILRRKKKDVLKSLPEKIENNIYIELPNKQKKLYLKVLNDTKKEMDNLINIDGFNKSKLQILSLLTKLRQICIDPQVLYENYDGESIKIEELINIVKENIESGHKILIFSSFKRILERVSEEFNKENITSYMITGTTKVKDRGQLVEKFNKDNTNCFLITLKAGGVGLNLTGADVVIHLDIWWNPAVENQATDRAHRIGQKNKVNVIKLVTKGTIEEKILELQNKKKDLSDNLLDNNLETNSINNLTEKDIKNLLSFTEE